MQPPDEKLSGSRNASPAQADSMRWLGAAIFHMFLEVIKDALPPFPLLLNRRLLVRIEGLDGPCSRIRFRELDPHLAIVLE